MRALLLCALLLPALALGQPIGTNCSSASAVCKASKFSLVAGKTLCFNSATCTSTIKADATSSGLVYTSGVANSGTNVAHVFDTTVALSGTTLLASWRNNGVEAMSLSNAATPLLTLSGQMTTTSDVVVGGFLKASASGVATASTVPLTLISQIADGASSVMIILDKFNGTMSTPGAKLLSVRNNTVEKAAFNYAGVLGLDATDSSGTPGNATVNKPSGQAAIAASAGAVTVTNSVVTSTSIIHATLQFTDATCVAVKSVVPGSGTFTINVNAVCTANTKVGWTVFNGN